jgi:tRNA threonylcarbamoyladenosine biosynthesis protein TsaB
MLLAIESSDRLCGVCVLNQTTGRIIASKTLDIGKGHAELLMGVVSDVLQETKLDYLSLTSIAVCVGPGSFTGIRVGVAAAIGFGIALNIPVIGITSLQALGIAQRNDKREILCLIDAHRGDVYAQAFSPQGFPLDLPRQIAVDEVAQMQSLQSKVLCGSGVAIVQAAHPQLNVHPASGTNLAAVESIALAARNAAMTVDAKPLYLRRPDAKPQEAYTLARSIRAERAYR